LGDLKLLKYRISDRGYNSYNLVPEDEYGVINWRKYRMK
jgi:hypothetical protein